MQNSVSPKSEILVCELWAPVDYWEMPEFMRDQHWCGPGRGVMEKLVQDVWYIGWPFVKPLRITPACRIHDYMYEFGPNDIKWKEKADRAFLNNMIRLVDYQPAWRIIKRLRYKKARTYYVAVKVFGGPAFWKGRNPAEELHTDCFC